jgi:hypothetical protein
MFNYLSNFHVQESQKLTISMTVEFTCTKISYNPIPQRGGGGGGGGGERVGILPQSKNHLEPISNKNTDPLLIATKKKKKKKEDGSPGYRFRKVTT